MCVSLSRAKHGFYVIGNFKLMSDNSDLWRKIVRHAKMENLYGEGLHLYCQNHLNDAGIYATMPEDFKKAPEGGCMKPCEYRLPCGHTCSLVCHVIDAHHKKKLNVGNLVRNAFVTIKTTDMIECVISSVVNVQNLSQKCCHVDIRNKCPVQLNHTRLNVRENVQNASHVATCVKIYVEKVTPRFVRNQ